LFLFSIAFCSSSTKQDKFPSILQQFVELNEAMGADKPVDAAVTIAQVANAVQTAKKKSADFFRTLETHCASAVAAIKNSIKELGTSSDDAKNQLNKWKVHLTTATKDAKDAQENIVKARQQLKAIKKRVAKLAMDYRVYASEADKKLMVVKVLRDIITDELYNKGPRALVQINKFQQKLSELKELLNNNSDSLYSPIISVLLDLATEQNFADQGVLKKILQNLTNLDKALKDFRLKQEKALDEEMKNVRAQAKNTRQRIRAYRRMRSQSNSKRIDATHYINFYTHEIAHFTAETGRKQEELNMFTKLCEFEKSVHKKSVAAHKWVKAQTARILGNLQKLSK